MVPTSLERTLCPVPRHSSHSTGGIRQGEAIYAPGSEKAPGHALSRCSRSRIMASSHFCFSSAVLAMQTNHLFLAVLWIFQPLVTACLGGGGGDVSSYGWTELATGFGHLDPHFLLQTTHNAQISPFLQMGSPRLREVKSRPSPPISSVSSNVVPREAPPPPHTPCPTVPVYVTAHITTCDYLVICLSGSVSPLQGELHEGRVCPVIAALPEPRTGAWKISTH